MTRPDPLVLLRSRAGASGPETPECLDDGIVAALADGTLVGAARDAALSHVAVCPRCRGIVASVARSLSDPAVAKEVAALGRGRPRYWIALPIAAAVLVLAIAVPRLLEEGPTHRAPPGVPQAVPVPLSPIGTVAAVANLRWRSVPDAYRYRVTLFGASGRVVYETQLTDTVVTLPDSVALAPGQYLWKVDARIGADRWSSSDLVPFSLLAARP